MKLKKGIKRYKNTEHYKKVKQAEAELDKKIKETSSQSLKQRNQKIKETSSQFLKQRLAYLFLLLLPLALMALGFTFSLFLLLLLITLGFTFLPLHKIYLVVFSPLITRLGIASWLNLPRSRWFNDNFDLTREGQSSWSIRTKSGQGFFCLLVRIQVAEKGISEGYAIS